MPQPSNPDPQLEPPAPKRRSPAANSAQELITFVYPVLLTIGLTPLILHFIGAEQYGIFALATVFVGFLGLIDVGMAPVVTRFLSASLARSDYREARAVLAVGVSFFGAVGVIGATVAIIGAQFLPDILSLPPHLRTTATFVISVAGIGFFFDSLLPPITSIPGALQRFDTATSADLTATTVSAAGSVIALSLGWGLRGLIIMTVLQPALVLVLVARSNRRLMPNLPMRPGYDRALLREMMSFSGYSFVSNVAGSVLFQVDKVLLGVLGNVSLVTYYVVPGNVAQRLHVGVARLTAVALPVAADLHARGEANKLRDFYVRATRAASLIVVSLSVPAFVFSRQLLHHWVGESFATTSFGTLRLLIITYALLALTALPYYIALGVGQPRLMAGFNVITALINVVLIVILIPRYGLIGAAVAYLASTITIPPLILYVERRLLDLDRSPWPSLLGRLSLVAAGQTAACLALRPLATGLAQVIALLIGGAAIGPALALLTGYLTPSDRATMSRLLPIGRLRTRGGVEEDL